jgi:hypothetical protein
LFAFARFLLATKFVTIQINALPTGTDGAYMNSSDNPQRPRNRLWFGPLTMIQYISDIGILK